jgi:hypothetical protein
MKAQTAPQALPQHLADDLLRGANEIAKFLFGPSGSRRKVYYLAQHTRLPVFRLGSLLCARKSILMKYIEDQECRDVRTDLKETAKSLSEPTGERGDTLAQAQQYQTKK